MSRATRNFAGQPADGFTLVEMVVAITVSAVVIGYSLMFLSTPVQAYFAQTRRAQQLDAAEMVSRHMARDIRTALPNSMRVRTNGNFILVEMLSLEGSAARYRPVVGMDTPTTLRFNLPDASFSIIGQLGPSVVCGTPLALPGRRLAVGGVGTNFYTSLGVITTAATSITVDCPAADEEIITLGPAFSFQTVLPSPRIFLVSSQGMVGYLCDLNLLTVRRYSGYPITATANPHDTPAELAALSATNTLIADNVTACTFRLPVTTPGARGLVSLQVTLTRNGEVLRVFDEVPLQLGP